STLIAEAVIETNEHGVRTAGRSGDKMKVVAAPGQIRLGNEVQQLRGGGVDRGNRIPGDRRVGDRVEQSRRVSGKISRPRGQSRHRGKQIVGTGPAAATIVAEEKCLGPAVIDVRNIERASHRETKRVAVVIGFFFRLSAERVWLGVK